MRGSITAAYLGERRVSTRRSVRAFGRRLFGRKRRLVFFHRVDSPQSYLLAQALERFLGAYEFELEIVVVPAPAADFDPEPALRARHELRDAVAVAPCYGLTFPAHAELPHEARVRMANAVLLKGRPAREQLRIAVALSRALFEGDGDGLHRLSDELGTASGQEVRPRLEAGYRRLRAEGHFQEGALAFEGEWYVGVDRLVHLEERVHDEGGANGPLLFGGPAIPAAPAAAPRVPVEVFFSFRSPFSYLGLARLARLAETHPIDIVPRPVLPLVMRGVVVPDEKLRYIVFDAAREARRHDVPFGRLRDPLGDGVERCLSLAAVAARADRALPFALAAMEAIWNEAADLRDDERCVEIAERAGLDAPSARAALARRDFRAFTDANLEALAELGLWGVPSFRVGDRAFFGQDRLPLVVAEVVKRA